MTDRTIVNAPPSLPLPSLAITLISSTPNGKEYTEIIMILICIEVR